MSSGSTSPVVTQTQSRDPWSGAQPYLSNMYGYAQALQTGNVGYQPYTGPVVADVDPSVSQGLGMQSGLASSQWGGPGEQALYNAQALGNQFIGQGGLSPTAQQAL